MSKIIKIKGHSPTEEQSLPLGNGLCGANVWVGSDGLVHLLISHAEAYSETCRLSKLGTINLRINHPALLSGEFEQVLDMELGTLTLQSTGGEFRLVFLVDAHHPCIRLLWESEIPLMGEVHVVLARPVRREIVRTTASAWAYEEAGSFLFLANQTPNIPVEPDEFIPLDEEALCWCHRNPYSFLHQQAGRNPASLADDPLDGLTFGGFLQGEGWGREGRDRLHVATPAFRSDLAVTLLCQQTENIKEWASQISKVRAHISSGEEALAKHQATWKEVSQRSWITMSGGKESEALDVGHAYSCQRYLTACAGTGKWPIRFNGSMFNVAWKMVHPNGQSEDYDADYRRWHCGFWGQNTRLIYWPMLAAGEFNFIRPYFDLYRDTLPAAKHRARLLLGYEGRGGAYFWETMNFWDNVEVQLQPQKKTSWRYFHSSLEMLMLAYDYLDFTQDIAFIDSHLLPLTISILSFYLDAGEWDAEGRYRLISYSTETYHDAVNAAPDLAGLQAVLPRAIESLGQKVPVEQLVEWRNFLEALPPLPTRNAETALPMMEKQMEHYRSMGVDVDVRTASQSTIVLSPAAELPHPAWNVENPEIYPIFPFRNLGIGKPNLALAQDTFRYRRFQHDRGWAQDPIIAAFVGLTDEAKRLVLGRSVRRHQTAVFPAFWEAGFDWCPDQDNGGVFTIALQSMLLQWEGKRIFLLPAWPKEWNVSFKLHAPFKTVIEGSVQQGKLESLRVYPGVRAKDIVIQPPYSFPL